MPEITLLRGIIMEDFPPIIPLRPEPTYRREDGESILDFTQRVRLASVTKLTERNLPDDPKDVSALSQMLDSIDRQEFNKAKIEIESQGANADKDALDLITAIVNTVGNNNPYLVDVPVVRDVTHNGPIVEGLTLVPGELDNKPVKMNYDSFMKKYKEDNPQQPDDEDD